MKSGFVLFSIIAILILTGCKKDELKSIEDRLVGEWAWVSSTGGLIGTTLTPATEGFTESILFQKNGIFTHFRDTATLYTNFYWVGKGTSIYAEGEVSLLYLGNQDHTQVLNTYSIEFNGEKGLILKEECNDCFEIVYTKKD